MYATQTAAANGDGMFVTRKGSYFQVDSQQNLAQKSLIFSVPHRPGSLRAILDVFEKHNVNMTRIESRLSKSKKAYDFFVDFAHIDDNITNAITEGIRSQTLNMRILDENPETDSVPWFPRKIKDLDRFATRILNCGSELEADHPGFNDPVYRKRRQELAKYAIEYRHGTEIPRIDYTEEEIQTWNTVYDKLIHLYPTHACREHNYIFPLLQENCGYGPSSIPQLQDISNFLKDCTGFTLRPVAGLLSSRDFLAGLAFRVFHSTQYIRHSSRPLYTPEPDVCHELLGHVPLFANPSFAAFSQEIGLASLGATDEDIERLATCYWFTVEFGLCREGTQTKAYGAGLLSSFGELEYCLSDQPKILSFDPPVTGTTKYPITEYQPTYFVATSFVDAQSKMREFAATLKRPFGVHYNAYTQTVEVLNDMKQVENLLCGVANEMMVLRDAMSRLNEDDDSM